MPLRILHDLHLGVNRSAGTTASSRLALKASMLNSLITLLPESDLMILGDLFDTYEVPLSDVLAVYEVFNKWLDKGFVLYMVSGNHDLSKTSTTLSSFEFLCALLKPRKNVQTVFEPRMTTYGYVIPHLPNQTLFDAALTLVPECDYLFLHCNYSNMFAVQSDHSLNLSKEQADVCLAKEIIIAHEHNMRMKGKVTLPGCQIASSVSDWQSCNTKYYAEIAPSRYVNNTLLVPATTTLTACAEATEDFVELDWKSLEQTSHKFVRVTGAAKVGEAAQVVNAIAKFRAKSDAFVVSNAVQMEQNEALSGFSEALEAVQGFDVWKALETSLQADDVAILRGLT